MNHKAGLNLFKTKQMSSKVESSKQPPLKSSMRAPKGVYESSLLKLFPHSVSLPHHENNSTAPTSPKNAKSIK